jgi:hypothetical protein
MLWAKPSREMSDRQKNLISERILLCACSTVFYPHGFWVDRPLSAPFSLVDVVYGLVVSSRYQHPSALEYALKSPVTSYISIGNWKAVYGVLYPKNCK